MQLMGYRNTQKVGKTMLWKKTISLLLLITLFLTGCESEEIIDKSDIGGSYSEEENEQAEIQADSAVDEENGLTEYEIESLLPNQLEDKQYHWVILQNGRATVRQGQVQAINDRLQELGVEASIVFHVVTMVEYVTPMVLEQVEEQLEGKMDFVSIGPALCAFDMDEWEANFIELSDELKEGKMNEFYLAVPEVVWTANRIGDGIYSFSNMTEVQVHGYAFGTVEQDEYGIETLTALQEANGIENEEPWKKLLELSGKPVCLWTGLYWGKPAPIEENPYLRTTLRKLANGYEDLYFIELTDDIRFNIEKGKFEWLLESETYKQILNRVLEFYEKGYLGNDVAWNSDEFLTPVVYTNAAKVQRHYSPVGEETGDIFVPSWKNARVSKITTDRQAIYSLVYHQAEDGWEEVLNVLGSDEVIADILNANHYDLTISATVFESVDDYYYGDMDGADEMQSKFDKIAEVYQAAEANPLEGFVFNPYPVKAEWEEYNKKMTQYALVDFYHETIEEDDVPYANLEAIESVLTDMENMKEEAHIELILEELNRQYREWKMNSVECAG